MSRPDFRGVQTGWSPDRKLNRFGARLCVPDHGVALTGEWKTPFRHANPGSFPGDTENRASMDPHFWQGENRDFPDQRACSLTGTTGPAIAGPGSGRLPGAGRWPPPGHGDPEPCPGPAAAPVNAHRLLIEIQPGIFLQQPGSRNGGPNRAAHRAPQPNHLLPFRPGHHHAQENRHGAPRFTGPPPDRPVP